MPLKGTSYIMPYIFFNVAQHRLPYLLIVTDMQQSTKNKVHIHTVTVLYLQTSVQW